MRTKLTALIVTGAALAAGAVAHAAPIPVAIYTVPGPGRRERLPEGLRRQVQAQVGRQSGDVDRRQARATRAPTAPRWSPTRPTSTPIRGWSPPRPSAAGRKKLQTKSFVGVGVRRSDTAGYVLRVLPNKHKWQYLRDPKGAAGSKLEASGSGKFVKLGSKPNMIAIRAFSRGGTTTSVIAIGQWPRRRLRHRLGPRPARRAPDRGHGRRQGLRLRHRDHGRLRQRHRPGPEPLRVGRAGICGSIASGSSGPL